MYVFDLDGVLADPSHRSHHLIAGDWEGFFDKCELDGVFTNTFMMLAALRLHVECEIWTGRPERVREKTENWFRLVTQNPQTPVIRMRPDGDHCQDWELKERWLAAERRRVLLVIDDSDDVVEMCQRRRVPVALMRRGAMPSTPLC